MQQHVGNFLQALRIPHMAQQQAVGDANDSDVNSNG